VAGEIVKTGGKAFAIQADVAKRADVQRLFAETIENMGRPSILVHNAGVYRMDALESVTEEDFAGRDPPFAGAAPGDVIIGDDGLSLARTNLNIDYAELLARNGLSTLVGTATTTRSRKRMGPGLLSRLRRGERRP
jgi:hypothetical protein